MKLNPAIKAYIKNQLESLKVVYPDVPEKELLSFIAEEVRKNYLNPQAVIYNNYTKETRKTDLNEFLLWYFEEKPITTEHGVLYKVHEKAPNHTGDMISMFLSERKKAKKQMFEALERKDTASAAIYDTNQKVWKILGNSAYGVLGQSASVFYNDHAVLSVTGKGQSVISTAMTTFENFLTGSIKLKNIDELLIYTNKIKKECDNTTSLPEILLDDISDEKVRERLKTYCENGIMNLDSVIDKIIESCNQKQKNLLYFKNNLFAFLEEKPVFSLIETIMKKVKEFRNAAEPPKEIEEDLNKLWHMAKYYVFYNHVKFNKINILKNDEREAVLGVKLLAPIKLF